MQYVTSRRWNSDIYVGLPSWWSQWDDSPYTATPTYTFTTYAPPSGFSGIGVTILPDGRALFGPRHSTYMTTFDYKTNSFSTFGSLTTILNKTVGACMLPDGRAILCQNRINVISTFDYRTNTVATLAGYNTDEAKYSSMTLLPDGKVFMTPGQDLFNQYLLFDYVTNSAVTRTNPTATIANMYSGCALLPDGRVACVPFLDSVLGLYDYRTDSWSTVQAVTGFRGGAIAPNGNLVCAPYTANVIGMFDYRTNAFTTVATTLPSGGNKFLGATRMIDGNILFAPFTVSYAGIFDYRTNSLNTSLSVGGITQNFGCNLLPDGRILLARYLDNAAAVGVISQSAPGPVLRAPAQGFVMHPAFNHGI
jgi:hypothetical protein